MNLADELALALVAMGTAAPMLAGAGTGNVRSGLSMMMELWTAAGLLRLAGNPGWNAIFSAATIIAVRKLVLLQLRRAWAR